MVYSSLNPNAVVVEYLRQLFLNDPLVNDVQLIDFKSEMDLQNASLFPKVYILPNGFRYADNSIEFLFEIAVVSERNIEPSNTDNFYKNNFIDNLNDSCAIIMKALNNLMMQENQFGIQILEGWSANVIADSKFTLLDGYEASIVLSMQNEVPSCPSFYLDFQNTPFVHPSIIGATGSKGATGATGSQGIQGIQGIQGATGSSGTSGTSGLNGLNGTSGTSGLNGLNGTSGTSGLNGLNGSSGTSGISGVNGTSGTSGIGSASGTTNYVAKFTGTTSLGNSQIFDNGTNVGIGTISPQAKLDIKSQGASASDIVLRVRNNTDTDNLFQVNGEGKVALPIAPQTSSTSSDILVRNSSNGEIETKTISDVLSDDVFTIELIDAQTVDFYAPKNMKINSITNLVASPTTTLEVNSISYTLGTSITQGSKITVDVNIASVINLNVKYE